MKKRIHFLEHAEERFIERNIPIARIREMLRDGVVIPAKEKGRKLCVYKQEKAYYTVVFQEFPKDIVIITGREANGFEINEHNKRKWWQS